MTKQRNQVIVIGGGYAGVLAANRLTQQAAVTCSWWSTALNASTLRPGG